jgi:hypothetical protein
MSKYSLIVSTMTFLFITTSWAQTPPSKPKTSSDKASSAQAAPKATKRDAKMQCRSEGKAGRELVDCIKARSQGE